jgi:hypothetical protein
MKLLTLVRLQNVDTDSLLCYSSKPYALSHLQVCRYKVFRLRDKRLRIRLSTNAGMQTRPVSLPRLQTAVRWLSCGSLHQNLQRTACVLGLAA